MPRHYTVLGEIRTFTVLNGELRLMEHDDSSMDIVEIYDDSGRSYSEDDPIWQDIEAAIFGELY